MGKGSSKGHTPREAKDNLKSTQLLSVIDAISEGPVEGIWQHGQGQGAERGDGEQCARPAGHHRRPEPARPPGIEHVRVAGPQHHQQSCS